MKYLGLIIPRLLRISLVFKIFKVDHDSSKLEELLFVLGKAEFTIGYLPFLPTTMVQ